MDGSRLRELRRAARLSSREVGKAAGVSARSVERAEARDMREETFVRYTNAVLDALDSRKAAVNRALEQARLTPAA